MSFSGKVVIVTGGSSGIGASTALKFAENGAKVAIVGRNQEKLNNVAKKCEQVGSKPLVIICDISKVGAGKTIVTETIRQFNKIDILVNNAGFAVFASILSENAMDVFDNLMDTNLRAVVDITNQAVKHIIESKGNIINISSIAGMGVVNHNSFAYSASKAAVDHFTKCIALELAPKGVRVNGINPGPVKTDIMEKMMAGLSQEVLEMLWKAGEKATPLQRTSEPEEIADLVLFIASEKSRGITGSTIVSDNGALLFGLMEMPDLEKMFANKL